MTRSMPGCVSVNGKCSSAKYRWTAIGNLAGVREPLVWCPVPTQINTCSRCWVLLTLRRNCAISRFNTGIASLTWRPCKSICIPAERKSPKALTFGICSTDTFCWDEGRKKNFQVTLSTGRYLCTLLNLQNLEYSRQSFCCLWINGATSFLLNASRNTGS